MKRKILSLFIALCVTLGTTIYPANMGITQAEDQEYDSETSDGYRYKILDDGTIEITKYVGEETKLEIPSQIDGKTVSSIGEYAFCYCEDITDIAIQKGPVKIGASAFSSCHSLESIIIPEGVMTIEESAFYYCDNLESIIIPEGITRIEDSVFKNCKFLEEVVLPASLISIEDGAFDSCEYLTDILIPNGVTRIGDFAFNGCRSLNNMILPDSLIELGNYVFGYCDSLTSITIPSGLTNIGVQTFGECENLASLIVDENNPYYSSMDGCLYNKDKTVFLFCLTGKTGEIRVQDGVASIADSAFKGCYGITGVIIPESVKSIGNNAFDGCSSLTDLRIPDAAQIIGNGAFLGCRALKSIRIPGGVTKIGDETFSGCENLESINLPESVADIGEYAFSGCKNLKSVDLPERLSNIGRGAFSSCSQLNDITIPGSLKTIGDSVFGRCSGLTKIVIPDTIVSIEDFAFHNCSGLTEFTIPSSTTVGYRAFRSCSSLKAIHVPEDHSLYLSEDGILYNKDKTVLIICPEGKEGSIVIPDGVLSIGDSAFEGCSGMTSLAFPISVKETGYFTFFYCIGLKDVYYAGSKSQWDEIKMNNEEFDTSNGNENVTNANIHYNTYPGGEEVPDEPDNPLLQQLLENARQELEKLKANGILSLDADFQNYLSEGQIDVLKDILYTWLAEINDIYKYSGTNAARERMMKKIGIDPQGDFDLGTEKAVTHISAETKYGLKTIEITLDLGKPDSSGNLYPAYGAMQYEILEKKDIPPNVPTSGRIGGTSYTALGAFAECISKISEHSLHSVYEWQSLSDEMVSSILVDKTVTEIIGNNNGSFSANTFVIYEKPLLTYNKKVTVSCPVDVRVCSMDGSEIGSIINNEPKGGNENVQLYVNGDVKTIYLAGNDYYLNLNGTDTGTMKYEVEEIANDKVRRNVQFLELQLKEDMQYEGYVFRPLNIDRDLYALRRTDGSSHEMIYADHEEQYEKLSVFKQIQEMHLSQQNTTLDADKNIQLNASLFPLDASNPNLQWKSDNESVVTVDQNGFVTAVGAGRTTVTVSTRDGSFLKQFCIFEVAAKNNNNNNNNNNNSSNDNSNHGSSANGSNGSSGSAAGQGNASVIVKMHYVIQFDLNGGTDVSRRTMTLLKDDILGIMPKARRKDYVFSGWYTKQNGGVQVMGNQPLNEAATLYAHWTKAEAPEKSELKTLKPKKRGKVQVVFENVSGAAGYQIEYSSSKTFESAAAKEARASAKSKTISGLKAGKKYYIRVRAYSQDSMKNRIYGSYSDIKSVMIG